MGFNFSNKKIIHLLMVGSLLLLLSCKQEEISYRGESRSFDIYLESARGTNELRFQTNAPWTAEVTPETSWASIQDASGKLVRNASGEGNDSLILFFTKNVSFNRVGTILVGFANSTVVDTIRLKQYGETAPVVELKDSLQIAVNAGGGTLTAKIETNLTTDMAGRITLAADEAWIENLKLNNLQSISFFVKRNATGKRRTSALRIIYIDDVESTREVASCRITQDL